MARMWKFETQSEVKTNPVLDVETMRGRFIA